MNECAYCKKRHRDDEFGMCDEELDYILDEVEREYLEHLRR